MTTVLYVPHKGDYHICANVLYVPYSLERGGRSSHSNKKDEVLGVLGKIGPDSGFGSQMVSNQYGTYKTVRARFWPWLSDERRDFQMKVIKTFCRCLRSEGGVLSHTANTHIQPRSTEREFFVDN